MNAEIDLEKKDADVLPVDAVVRHEDHAYVFKDEGNGRYRMIEVNTGTSAEGQIQVEWPVYRPETGDRFVAEGAYGLLMKLMNTAE